MHFKLDENLPVELAELLANQGWDCPTVADQGLAGYADSDIATVCRAEGGILVMVDGCCIRCERKWRFRASASECQ